MMVVLRPLFAAAIVYLKHSPFAKKAKQAYFA
jgi:hypothetical protein